MSDEQLGKYRILGEIGKGGFATVYRAVDTTLERTVALKVLDPLLARDPDLKARFKIEAKAVARLSHPHIVKIWEIGESEGRLFIAMELLEGPSLARRIADQGALPWDEAMTILRQVADALDYAHSQGVIHRDLKPANILLDPQRGALLTDFGFARLVGESSMSVSVSGGIVGTPAYIAPEVWEGEGPTAATDLYSLACVAYEMLTGQVLFEGKTPAAVMKQHVIDGPQLAQADGLPTTVRAALSQGLAKEPAARFETAPAFVAALADSAQIPPHPPPPPPRRARKTVPLLLGGGALMLVLAVAYLIALQQPQGARSPAAAPPVSGETPQVVNTPAAPTATGCAVQPGEYAGLGGDEIFRRAAKIYAAAASYQDTFEAVLVRPEIGDAAFMTFACKQAFFRPSQYRLQCEQDPGSSTEALNVYWMNGDQVRIVSQSPGEQHTDSVASLESAFTYIGIGSQFPHRIPSLLFSFKEPAARWKGMDATWIRLPDMEKCGSAGCFALQRPLQANAVWQMKGGSETIALDRCSLALIKAEEVEEETSGGTLEITTSYKPMLNQPVPESALEFNPPGRTPGQ